MIIFILILALVLRIISLNQSLWLDEAINVLAAKNNSLWGMITQYAAVDFHPPGYFIILWGWIRLFGFSEIAVRLPSVVFGVLTVFLTYLIGNKLSKRLGLLAAFILAINPLHVYYSQEARMYSLAAFLVCLNFLLFIRLFKEEKVNYFTLILSNLLVLTSDYLAYLIFPAQLFFLLINKNKKILKKWIISFITSLTFWIIWVPVFINQLKVGLETSNNLPGWKAVVGSSDLREVGLTLIKLIIGRISFPDKAVYYTSLIFPVSIFIFLIIRGVIFSDTFKRNLLLSWFLIPIGLAWAISFIVPVFSYFRVLFIIPSFIILTVLGIDSFKSRIKYFILFLVILIELLSSLTYLLNPVYQREDWKGLVSFLKTQPDAVVLSENSGSYAPFDYYAKNQLTAEGALKKFPVKSSDELIDLKTYLRSKNNVYLIDYLVEISDPNHLVSEELTNLGYKTKDVKNFNGVGFLYHFSK